MAKLLPFVYRDCGLFSGIAIHESELVRRDQISIVEKRWALVHPQLLTDFFIMDLFPSWASMVGLQRPLTTDRIRWRMA